MKDEQVFHVHKLENGVTLVAERMNFVSSAAFSIAVPIGACTDPAGLEGAAAVLVEMFNKGAGPWTSRELSEEFEKIGVRRSHSAGIELSVFGGVLLGEHLLRALEIYGIVLSEPHFPEEELESLRELSLQELSALEDEPSSLVMVELARSFYPQPFGRCQLGTREGLSALSLAGLRDYFEKSFAAQGSIIAVAGKFEWPALLERVERSFGSWQGKNSLPPVGKLPTKSSSRHVGQATSQLQIALAYPSVPAEHPDYYTARTAVGVLSGGMFGRLFVEVREKRGLVYRVGASHSAARGRAAVFAYAGTTPEHGQETLDVTISELEKLKLGVGEEELQRAKVDLKSRLVMQGEHTSVRASALVNDWWNLETLRSLSDIKEAIDAVTPDDLVRHLNEFPVDPVTLVTLGPQAVEFKR